MVTTSRSEAGGIHEDEGHAGFIQRVVVAAGGFALAAFQVEVAHLAHGAQAVAQVGVEAFEDGNGLFQQLLARCSKGRSGGWPLGSTSRSQGRRAGRFRSWRRSRSKSSMSGTTVSRMAAVEVEAVLGRVVEAAQGGKHVVAEVGEAGVQGHLVAQAAPAR